MGGGRAVMMMVGKYLGGTLQRLLPHRPMRQVQCFLYPAFQMIYPHWLCCLNLLPHLDALFDPGLSPLVSMDLPMHPVRVLAVLCAYHPV